MTNSIHPATLDVEDLLRDCETKRTRRSGPGGQHRNKVETAVVLKHRPTGVIAEASERRSQSQNLKSAVRRLRIELALSVRTEPPNRPSELWQSRCRSGKVIVSADHVDYPAMLAEALDHITACEFDAKEAATRLGCSSSQLVKLLAHEPRALQLVNRRREERNLKSLRR